MMKKNKDIKALYIHIPFCHHICDYCDFPKLQYFRSFAEKYLVSLEKEIEQYRINKNLETIYIGGGTPTALDDDLFYKLLSIVKPYSGNIKEYTIETTTFNLLIPTRQWYDFAYYEVTGISTNYETDSGTKIRKTTTAGYLVNEDIAVDGANAPICVGSYGNITVEAYWKQKTYTLNFSTIDGVAPSVASVTIYSFTAIIFSQDFEHNTYSYKLINFTNESDFNSLILNPTPDVMPTNTVTYTLGSGYTDNLWKYKLNPADCFEGKGSASSTYVDIYAFKIKDSDEANSTITVTPTKVIKSYNIA